MADQRTCPYDGLETDAAKTRLYQHGVKRQRPGQRDPEDVAQAKLAKEQSRIAEYTALRQDLAQAVSWHSLSRPLRRRALPHQSWYYYATAHSARLLWRNPGLDHQDTPLQPRVSDRLGIATSHPHQRVFP